MVRRGTESGRHGSAIRRGQKSNKVGVQNRFQTSRTKDVDLEASDNDEKPLEENLLREAENGEQESESDVDLVASGSSYTSLLQALRGDRAPDERPRKRRKTIREAEEKNSNSIWQMASGEGVQIRATPEEAHSGLLETLQDELDAEDEVADSDDEEAALQDPFERHYAGIDEHMLQSLINAVTDKTKHCSDTTLPHNVRKLQLLYSNPQPQTLHASSVTRWHLRSRLSKMLPQLMAQLSASEVDMALEIASYRDVQYGNRTVENSARACDIACLHALNHVFHTRDRVLKNNSRISRGDDNDRNLRDQGFTRPKVLFILPTKQACVRYIESIVKLSGPDQQENKSRLLETFSNKDNEMWTNKTADFRELFGGNHEEDFRVGLKLTRKTIKYFSGFYNSDIIFGSALGLRRTITTGGGGKDKKKGHDADFLSSIEIVVVDNAAAIQMQNWQHLDYVFTQLNLLPKEPHGCDFSRVRNWYLEGHARYLRQTILFTAHHTPEINSLCSSRTFNVSGMSKYTPVYRGAMLDLSTILPVVPPQKFLRVNASTPAQDADARFTYFATSILPSLLRPDAKGTLIFIPTYADFTRVRNHFSSSAVTASLSFGSISEYTSVRDVARARSHFMNGRHSVMIYSERGHHHFRYKIKGVRRILFYGVPENPIFWAEILGMLALNPEQAGEYADSGTSYGRGDAGGPSKAAVRALFSRWDIMKMERIVGTDRIGKLINERGGDVFEFI